MIIKRCNNVAEYRNLKLIYHQISNMNQWHSVQAEYSIWDWIVSVYPVENKQKQMKEVQHTCTLTHRVMSFVFKMCQFVIAGQIKLK